MIFFKVIFRKKFKLSGVYSIHSSTMSRGGTLGYPIYLVLESPHEVQLLCSPLVVSAGP